LPLWTGRMHKEEGKKSIANFIKKTKEKRIHCIGKELETCRRILPKVPEKGQGVCQESGDQRRGEEVPEEGRQGARLQP